jgi:hypothetical protein
LRSYTEGAEAFERALGESADAGPFRRDETQVARSSLSSAVTALNSDRQATNYLRDVIHGMPRGPRRYSRARERLLKSLADLDAAFAKGAALVQDLVQRLERATD